MSMLPVPLPVYFAYGSNLDPDVMRARCPAHRYLCRAILHDHVLVFRGRDPEWGGAVATVEHAPGSMVPPAREPSTPAVTLRGPPKAAKIQLPRKPSAR